MIGPRSRAVGAPQWIGQRTFAPGSGCEVRRIWSGRFEVFIVASPEKARRPAAMTGRHAGMSLFRGGRSEQRISPPLKEQYNHHRAAPLSWRIIKQFQYFIWGARRWPEACQPMGSAR